MMPFVRSRLRAATAVAIAVATAACSGAPNAPTAPAPSDAGVVATTQPSRGTATPAPEATTISSVVDGTDVTAISLAPDLAPMDVASGFGSIWVANHRSNSVSRIDPAALDALARIEVGSGPGWFVVTEDAVWVTNQLGRGLTRIDPDTNTADVQAGGWAPCGGPALGAGYIWQVACDAGVVMRIDPATNSSLDIYEREIAIAVVDGIVYAVQPDAISTIDPATGELDKVGKGVAGILLAFDDRSAWLAAGSEIVRVTLPGGEILARVPLAGEVSLTLAGDRAWATQFGLATHEVDVSTGSVLRTLHLNQPSVAREIDGVVWVTSFDANSLSWFTP